MLACFQKYNTLAFNGMLNGDTNFDGKRTTQDEFNIFV